MSLPLARRCWRKSGGKGIRTPDIQLAKLALYQLSYTPLSKEESKKKRTKAKSCAAGVGSTWLIIYFGAALVACSAALVNHCWLLEGFDLLQGP